MLNKIMILKRFVFLIFILFFSACTASKSTLKTDIIKSDKKNQNTINKIAILLPINNTLNQNMSEVIWEEFIGELKRQLEMNKISSIELMLPNEIREKLKENGYSYGDQLTQIDSLKKRLDFQKKLGVDGLGILTFDKIEVKNKVGFFYYKINGSIPVIYDPNISPSKYRGADINRSVKGSLEILINGEVIEKYNFDSTKTQEVSLSVINKASQMHTDTPLKYMDHMVNPSRNSAHKVVKTIFTPVYFLLVAPLDGEKGFNLKDYNAYFDDFEKEFNNEQDKQRWKEEKQFLKSLDPTESKDAMNYLLSTSLYKGSKLERYIIKEKIYGGSFYMKNIKGIVENFIKSSDIL